MPRSINAVMSSKRRGAEMPATQTSSHSSYTRSPTSKWLKRVKRNTTCGSRPSSTAVHSVGLVSPSLLQLLSDNGSSMPSVTLQQFPCSGCEEEVALGLDAPLFLCCSEQLLAKFPGVTGQSTNPNAPDTQKLAWHKRQEKHQNAMGHGDRKKGVALRAKEFVKSTDPSHQRRYKLRLAIASQV